MDWGKVKLGLWGAAGGAVVLAMVGFNWGGPRCLEKKILTVGCRHSAPICFQR